MIENKEITINNKEEIEIETETKTERKTKWDFFKSSELDKRKLRLKR